MQTRSPRDICLLNRMTPSLTLIFGRSFGWWCILWPCLRNNSCGDGFESGHHEGWFRVEGGRASYNLVLVYVSIRLRESVSLGQ